MKNVGALKTPRLRGICGLDLL